MSIVTPNPNPDIRVLVNGTWIPALPEHQQQYLNFLQKFYKYEDKHIIRAKKSIFGETYLKESNNIIPICDFNYVKIFLIDNGAEWVSARNYQTWAYFYFIYKNYDRIYFASKNSNVDWNHYVQIPIDNISPNIIFSVSRNENYSVYYEKNDQSRTRVRICDSEYARSGYLAYYHRMTDICSISVYSAPSVNVFDITKVINQKTSIEEDQCIICYDNKKNIRFNPCNHDVMCAACYLTYNKNKCPFCTILINSVGPI